MVGTVAIISAKGTETTETIKTVKTIETTETVLQPITTCDHILVSPLSFAIKTGVNSYMMAPVSPTAYDRINLMVGANLDYTINPLVGFGLEYNYNDYSRPYTYKGVIGELEGGTHDAMLYCSVNLSNAFSPYRTGFWRNLNIYGDFGGGIAFYNFNMDNGDYVSNSTLAPPTMLGKLGLNAEFTLTESFNLSIEGQYRQYDAPNLAASTSNRNCEALILSIGLRYKFSSRTLKHARNINLCEYSPKPVPVIVNETIVKGDTEKTLNRLKSVEQENADMKQRIKVLQENAIPQSTNNEGIENISIESIQFITGSSEFTLVSTQILDQVASILKNNSSWKGFKLYGHADYVGTSEYNQKLSEARAIAVKKYLISKGVPDINVTVIGMGENKPADTNDTPLGRQNNRRVEFEITK